MNDSWEQDHSYLFRMCSEYGWDEASALSRTLLAGIEERWEAGGAPRDFSRLTFTDNIGLRWRVWKTSSPKTVEDWLDLAHDQLYFKDPYGNSALHAACFNKPPLDVVDCLLDLARAFWDRRGSGPEWREARGADVAPVFAAASNDGSTPLLTATSTGCDTTVVGRFLTEIERYNETGRGDWRGLVLVADGQGYHPLQGYLSFHESYIRRHMADETIGAAGGRSGGGRMITTRTTDRLSYKEQVSSDHGLSDYWSLSLRMLCLATPGIHPVKDQSTPVLVHRCASIAPHCPPLLLEWCMTPFLEGVEWIPADASAAVRDGKGRLPLHRAIEAKDRSSLTFDNERLDRRGVSDLDDPEHNHHRRRTREGAASLCRYNNPMLERNRARIVAKLLRWHPSAASVPFPDGRSPFVQAVALGATWSPARTPSRDGPGGGDRESTGSLLRLLWRHAPGSLVETDPVTGLSPFMLAATVVGHADDRDAVDAAYGLLLNEPELITGGGEA